MAAVKTGATREFWLAEATDSSPQWSFLEDSISSSQRPAQLGRTVRLGDPINTGPNSNWQQLTWQGGTLQDIWKDQEMFKKGDADALTETGKLRMWPGFTSVAQLFSTGNARGFSFCQANIDKLSTTEPDKTPLYVVQTDYWPWDQYKGATYSMFKIDRAYSDPADPRAFKTIQTRDKPFRAICSVMADDYSSGLLMVTTKSRMWTFLEKTQTFVEDTGAPNQGSEVKTHAWDSMVGFSEDLYYLMGQTLWKRVPKAPYGTIGTHTVVKKLPFALYCRGLVVWNNRLWFGAMLPNGNASVYVSDGATSTKAFDFPQEFHIFNMLAAAGALYINGLASSSPGGRQNVVQQVWRYDGSSLKKLWQEGKFGDGVQHWPGPLTEWDGNIVWARQGVDSDTTDGRAKLMFYDPINDAIIEGPGLDRSPANTGGLYIYGAVNWNNTLVAAFRDATSYNAGRHKPAMIAYVRDRSHVRHQFAYPKAAGENQFKASFWNTETLDQTVTSSVYHGDDSVAHEQKTLLNGTVTFKCTGSAAHIDVSVILDESDTETLVTTLDDDGSHGWQTVTFPMKANGTGQYLQATRWQYVVRLYNDSTDPDSTNEAWVDAVNTQWVVAPKKRRMWTLRVPVSDAQETLDGNANSLTTADALAQKLEDLYYGNLPVKFWEPWTLGGVPGISETCEALITDFSRQESRLDTEGTAQVGYVSVTLVENVTS